MTSELELLQASWTPVMGVRTASTTRVGGVSHGRFASLNLSLSTDDAPEAVASNRQALRVALGIEQPWNWLHQVHGATVVDAAVVNNDETKADALVCRRPGIVCAITTADCLPVLLCDDHATVIGAAHAGWRGLAQGVVENTVQAMATPPERLRAWVGPCISGAHYEVGDEVRRALIAGHTARKCAFVATRPGHWLADLAAIARLQLHAAGIARVCGPEHCTYGDRRRFFSHRRDGPCGRMATLIWLTENT